jgi:hypothetical protein
MLFTADERDIAKLVAALTPGGVDQLPIDELVRVARACTRITRR